MGVAGSISLRMSLYAIVCIDVYVNVYKCVCVSLCGCILMHCGLRWVYILLYVSMDKCFCL